MRVEQIPNVANKDFSPNIEEKKISRIPNGNNVNIGITKMKVEI